MTDPAPWAVRRLGPGDEDVLAVLAVEDARFDLPGRSGGRRPLAPADAAAYLGHPWVRHWVAEAGGGVVGHLFALVLPRRCDEPREVLLYEMGVDAAWRGRGVGRSLLGALAAWQRANQVPDCWVPADAEAVGFYLACGFARDEPGATQLSRRVPHASSTDGSGRTSS